MSSARYTRKECKLTDALKKGDVSGVEKMLKEGFAMVHGRARRASALHLATYHGESFTEEMIETLISFGGDVLDTCETGETVISSASQWSTYHAGPWNALLSARPDPKVKNAPGGYSLNGKTPLHLVKNPQVAQRLIDYGYAVTERAEDGSLPLGHALHQLLIHHLRPFTDEHAENLISVVYTLIKNGSPVENLNPKEKETDSLFNFLNHTGRLDLITS